MNTETLVCKDSNGEHDSIAVGAGAYQKHKDHWEETLVLTCRDCGGKRVPEQEVEQSA